MLNLLKVEAVISNKLILKSVVNDKKKFNSRVYLDYFIIES